MFVLFSLSLTTYLNNLQDPVVLSGTAFLAYLTEMTGFVPLPSRHISVLTSK